MLPPVSPTYCAFPGDDESSGRIVRFDSECTLIPTSDSASQKQRSTLTTKSYSLPLWRKSSATYSSEPSQLEGDYVLIAGERSAASPPVASSSKSHVLLTVSIPRFKSSSKTTLRRVPSTGAIINVKPCLVDRDARTRPSGGARIPPQRRPSLPTNLPTTHKHTTVPLRSCCTGCYSIVEQSSCDSYEVKLPEARSPGRSASDGDSPREDVSAHGQTTRHCDVNDGYPNSNSTFYRDLSSPGPPPALDASYSPSPSPHPSPLLQTPVGVKDEELFPLPSCTKIRTSPLPSPKILGTAATSPKVLGSAAPKLLGTAPKTKTATTPPGMINTSVPYSPRLRAPPSPQLLAAARPMLRRGS
ncbi:hypothetical protein BDV98DRAFT_589976 [Pterulicium gracile]|uniref:Uncharacterized protein n=1 Tax=Pterulicium gracile TaxID=1884261 RepID=A0A5C3QTE5_9AGAR|nr:hypothetical protein BDV98DRAFT_589976 [Pterula gracilis]